MPIEFREIYKYYFLVSLQDYSFQKRKRNEPQNNGCDSWIEKIDPKMNFEGLPHPEQYAGVVKVMMDWRYNKKDAERFFQGFIRNF